MSEKPEQIPKDVKPLDKFTFSLNLSNKVKEDLESQLSAVEDRINSIANKVTVDGMPILKAILQTSHDKKELKRLAKGLDRVADLIEGSDQIKTRLSIIDTAHKDPDWFAWTFGDFSEHIDKHIESILDES
jgi:Trm5-related predicted tRNA methylase